MIIRSPVRRLALRRFIQTLLTACTLWTCLDLWTVRRAANEQSTPPRVGFGDQKIYIASLHWTDERVLRAYWISAIVDLAKAIGPSNVFVSIHESGSFDGTKNALQELDNELTILEIPHQIVLDDTTHLDEVSKSPADSGWIQMPETRSYRQNWTEWFSLTKGEWVPRRIPYLARLRNQVMQPLYEQQKKGIVYDKVLWLNDVVFTTENVRALLATRGGEFAAACALDFKHAPAFYDTFALRDAEGFAPLTDTWPYFQSASSRQALIHSEPVPVLSCWNGMLAFDAEPFYDVDTPLSFRGIPDGLAKVHLEGSESCLIHADNPLSRSKGVWVNPNVRVGYNGTAYKAVNARVWPSSYEIIMGLWRNRVKRWFGLSKLHNQRHAAAQKLHSWKREGTGRNEMGAFCLIDEMQILLWNGWGHA